MRFHFFCGLMMALFISAMPCMAKLIFSDNFENDIYTKNNWKANLGQLNWELSNKYNNTNNGKTSLKIEPKSMQVTDDVYHVIAEHPKPAHVRFWFYERGWKNKIKVDQQYVLIGDGTTSDDSANFCQIGQTGNPAHEGHYSIFDFAANAWFYDTKTTSNEPRWVKMEFVILKDGTAKFFIDDNDEYTFTQKWPHLGTIGLMSYGNNTRGGVLDGYWDDVEVFDTEDAPAFAVDFSDKSPSLWGKIKFGLRE